MKPTAVKWAARIVVESISEKVSRSFMRELWRRGIVTAQGPVHAYKQKIKVILPKAS
jgi:hypothetical protein